MRGRESTSAMMQNSRIRIRSAELDLRRNSAKFQAWNLGKSVVSDADRHDVKKAKKEGRLAEAMLDRRQKLKQ
jgi:hypothetical protein